MPTFALHIPSEHPAFAGHFPGMPITPGVVLLDLALYAIGEQLQRDIQHCAIKNLKFLNPVSPDTHLIVHYEVLSNGDIRFNIKDGQHIAATGVFHV